MLPPLSLVVQLGDRPQRIELTGELRPQWGGSLFLESGKPPTDSGLASLRKKALGAYLEHVVLAWKDPAHQGHGARFVFQQAKKDGRGANAPMVQEKILPFRPMTPDLAQKTLERWVLDLLTGNHNVLLPIEAVLAGWAADDLTPDSIRQFVEEAVEQAKPGRGGFSTLRGPVPEPTRYEPPADPWEIAQERYGDFLEQILPTVERAEVE